METIGISYPESWSKFSEMNHLVELLADVQIYNIDETMADIMYWGRQGTFAVKYCYRKIDTTK